MGGGLAFRKPTGSSRTLALISGFSSETNLWDFENLSNKSVVFPDCLGPVTRTAGKVFIAFLMGSSKVLGNISHP
jgi:hypothetical protein